MREIKFRAWDKEACQMMQVITLHLGEMKVLKEDDTWDWYKRDRVVMQYTGLQDKNGKEIYEGDIFTAPHDFGPGGFDVRKSVVHFHETQGYQWNYWDLEKLEVIGNIYENPNLLKEESA